MFVDPQALVAAAIELETAASKLGAVVSSAQPTLNVPPAGSEEVSISAAKYFTTASGSLTTVTEAAVRELGDTAAMLRRHAAAYQLEDELTRTNVSAPATQI